MCNANAHTMAFNQPKKKVNKKKLSVRVKKNFGLTRREGGGGRQKSFQVANFL